MRPVRRLANPLSRHWPFAECLGGSSLQLQTTKFPTFQQGPFRSSLDMGLHSPCSLKP